MWVTVLCLDLFVVILAVGPGSILGVGTGSLEPILYDLISAFLQEGKDLVLYQHNVPSF